MNNLLIKIKIEWRICDMAKARVIIVCKKCGEKFTWSKDCSNREEANKAEEWAVKNIEECPDCTFKAKIKYENQKAQELTEELQLPKLEGSEKQITWANTIRIKFIEYYNRVKSLPSTKTNKQICENFEDIIQKEITAKYWIDNRYSNIEDLTINKD